MAGTSAMKGLAIERDRSPMAMIGYRQPFTAHARTAPNLISAQTRTDVVGLGRAGTAHEGEDHHDEDERRRVEREADARRTNGQARRRRGPVR